MLKCFNKCGCTFYAAAATVRMNEANRDMVAFTRERAHARRRYTCPSANTPLAATQSFKPKLTVKKLARWCMWVAACNRNWSSIITAKEIVLFSFKNHNIKLGKSYW